MKQASIFIISTFLLMLIACHTDTVVAKSSNQTPLTTIGQVACGETRTIYINHHDSRAVWITFFVSDN